MQRQTVRGPALMVAMIFAAACAPQLAPVPATYTPVGGLITTTPPPLEAPVVEDPALVAIRMFDVQNGWAVSDTAILRTADGAATWHDVSPADSDFGYAATAEFLDALRGWVLLANPQDWLHGILYRTNDGGATWSESPTPFGGGSLQFIDRRRGWMMASLGAGAGSMAVAIFQTDDSGATWTQRYVNDPNQQGAGDSLPLGGLKDGITPINLEAAWIGGVVYEPGRIYLYQTSDGGRTWTESPVTPPEGYEEAELETTGPILIDEQIAFLPLHMSSQNGVMLATYVSRDGGASWLQNAEFIPQGGSLDFVSPEVGFAWNGQAFYLTTNGATSWTVVKPDVDFTDSFAGMDFVTPRVGFVLNQSVDGGAVIYMTEDSGKTWNVVGS